ncbi:hypothetical protein D6T17_22255 [Salmonella enterica subsp. enterica serovar Oranienburg]|nr:hypothetical protein [Salmonella enterica subsp. enterica serovar Oranienburg]EBY8947004.1 hypothetical protein [Salmonella enterica subsp. enterica serovar Oranienburg]
MFTRWLYTSDSFLNKQRLSGRLINIMALQRRMPAVYSVTICQECVHTTLQRFFSVQGLPDNVPTFFLRSAPQPRILSF